MAAVRRIKSPRIKSPRIKSPWAAFSGSRKGGTAILVAVAIPALVLLGGLSVDQSYVNMRASMLRRTVQSAALAGGQYLSTYYPNGSSATIVSKAQATATTNMPSTQYGTVVPSANIVMGTWNSTAKTFTATTTNPTAVQVTGLNTANNGNAVTTFFGGAYGKPTVDISSSAVVSYGTGKAFNTIILNDLSMSFSSEIADQRTADLAILNCVSGAASTTSQVGITGFTGHSQVLYALGNAVTNSAAMTTYVNKTENYCGNKNMPACSGSNVAAGLYSAITQLQAAGLANASSNIILITDGVPNADSLTYARADGIYPTPTSLLPVCTILCSDANLWTMAQDQAAYAKTLGINISAVYYSGDTVGTANQTAYATALASLVSGTGIALVAPTAAQIDASFGSFCASMGSAVKLVH
jgi:Flp pilus assembly protein TadG